jgi:hypothetical protein
MKVLGQLYGDGRSPYLNEGEQRFFVVHVNDGKCTDYYQADVPPPRKEFDFIFEIPAVVFEEVVPVGLQLSGVPEHEVGPWIAKPLRSMVTS